MTKLTIFDPPMCCTSGVCGPSVDPVLPRFSADLDWLKGQGVEVERHNLAQQPAAFASNSRVKDALREFGNECLPLLMLGDEIVSRGTYPERSKLAQIVGLEAALSKSSPEKDANSACCSSGVVGIGGSKKSTSGGCC